MTALRLWRCAAWALRLDDYPRGQRRWYRMTLAVLEHRYQAALKLYGRDNARPYDYVPF